MPKSQIEKVKDRLWEVGYVDNFWAIDNYILRLGAIIHTLHHKHGYNFTGAFGKELKKERRLWKNYYYHGQHGLRGVKADLIVHDEYKEPPAIIKKAEPVTLPEKDQLPLW
jgi:hypothetical protein